MVSAPSTTNGNGISHTPTIAPGVYAPLNTFFLPGSQDLDIPTLKRHAVRIAGAGVGVVACGSMGEAPHLSHAERNLVVRAVREALDENNLGHIPLIAGTGALSTRETIELTKEAAEAGATQAMVIAPGYFAGALSKDALREFFVEVAKESPIPIIIYNYPAAASGIDLDSDLVTEIASLSPNIIGIKLTCGSVGKLTRLTTLRPDFGVLGGFIDFLGPSLMSGSVGGITGTANVAPKSCLRLFELTTSGLAGSATGLAEAIKLQSIVSAGDWALQKGGISGTKLALEKTQGYGGVPRRPILPFAGDEAMLMKGLESLVAYEKSLP